MSMLVPFRAWRVTSQFVAFIFPVIVLVVGCAAWMIYQQNVSRLHDKLTKRADSITTQILADRDYYSSVIVPRLIQMGGIVDADYRLAHGRFPLPVTFVQEVSDAIVAHGGLYKSQLIGPWPINERKGLSDQFQREAFAYIRSHSAEQFFRLDTLEGRAVFRYLSADRATAQSCLDCHNNHPLSPKRDFKLHDVMGGAGDHHSGRRISSRRPQRFTDDPRGRDGVLSRLILSDRDDGDENNQSAACPIG